MITLPDMDDKKRLILIALAAVIFIYVDYITLFKFQTKAVASVNAKIAKSRKDLVELNKNLALMQETGKGKEKKIKRIISEEQLSLLLNEIENVARKNNVRITQIKAVKDPEKKKGKQPPKGEKSPPKVEKGPNYKLIPLDLSCSYHDFGRFLNELENMESFISVGEMKIKANPEDMLKQDVNLVLKAYVKR